MESGNRILAAHVESLWEGHQLSRP